MPRGPMTVSGDSSRSLSMANASRSRMAPRPSVLVRALARPIVIGLCAMGVMLLAGCVQQTTKGAGVPSAGPNQVQMTSGRAGQIPLNPVPSDGKSPARQGNAQAAIANTDPCALRLHDVSGLLLLYYMEHWQLPAKLDELTQLPGFDQVKELKCPQSGKPYAYTPDGILLPEKKQRVIVYDPEPSHSGMRLCIIIDEPQPDQPLLTRVIVLPESFFTFVSPAK